MLRLFVAIPLPEVTQSQLARVRRDVEGVRWLDPSKYHVTLLFLGDVADERVEQLTDALARVDAPSFDTTVHGLTTFPSIRHPRVLVAPADLQPAWTSLRERTETAARNVGLTFDAQRFRPHVTLARIRDAPIRQVRVLVQEAELNAAFPVRRFELWSSQLSQTGSRYESIASFPLGSG